MANTGTDRNWTGHLIAQANWYAFGRLAWDHQLTPAAIAEEWIRMTLTNDPAAVETIKKMMLVSRENTVNYMTPHSEKRSDLVAQRLRALFSEHFGQTDTRRFGKTDKNAAVLSKPVIPVCPHVRFDRHAFNMGDRSKLKTISTWPQRLADWLADNGCSVPRRTSRTSTDGKSQGLQFLNTGEANYHAAKTVETRWRHI